MKSSRTFVSSSNISFNLRRTSRRRWRGGSILRRWGRRTMRTLGWSWRCAGTAWRPWWSSRCWSGWTSGTGWSGSYCGDISSPCQGTQCKSRNGLLSCELTWSRWIWLWPGRGPRGWWSSRLGKCVRALDNDPRTRARTPQGRWPPAWQYTVIHIVGRQFTF